jgi:glyoxylase-like metal-dependent hydrolase (beta-lactamase superfamily II)
MRALAVHPDVIVVVSGIWQTTCVGIRSGDEGFVVDSPVLPDELDALPTLFEQAGFPVSGLLVTHGDWDHLLGRLAFPELSIGAAESTATRLVATPGEAQRRLREFDEQMYIAGRPPLGLGGVQPLPVPGRLSIGSEGDAELELWQADGHTPDGVAYWLPWASVLICGDYLSPIELPRLDGEAASAGAYAQTLERLAALVQSADTVVPGHGEPSTGEHAAVILREDTAYVAALVAGDDPPLPEGRRSAEQRRIHAANLAAQAPAGV